VSRRRKRAALSVLALLTGLALGMGMWVRSARHQEALNRQLITALVKKDPKQALALVNAGADPNTPVEPTAPLSLRQWLECMLHGLPPQRDNDYTAFHNACLTLIYDHGVDSGATADASKLVEAMIQHRANVNIPFASGYTPLQIANSYNRPDLVALLKQAGAKK
jgi:hypothetical protein